jgi:hypothetical protein
VALERAQRGYGSSQNHSTFTRRPSVANSSWDPRDDRVFQPTSVPDTQRIGLHIADRCVHSNPRELWFTVEGSRVPFRLDSLPALWVPQPYWHMSGVVGTWKKYPECSGHFFTLSWKTTIKGVRKIHKPTLTVHDVTPSCDVCSGRTNRRGWMFGCPVVACDFEMRDPNAPEP